MRALDLRVCLQADIAVGYPSDMKLFSCQACDNILYFENRICGQCGQRLGYVPETQTLTALEEEDPVFRAAGRGA